MNFNDFFALIKENTSNRLQNYKELCRFCLQHKSDGIDISADNYNTSQQRDTLLNNHLIITKQYLVISEEYPTFVCSSCESDLSQYALFVQQIENNSANWEIFLNTHNDVKVETDANIDKDEDTTTIEIEQIKVEYCEGNNVTNTQTYDIFDPSSVKNEIKKESLIDREILNDTVDNSTNRKKRIKKLKQPKSSDRQRYRVTTTTEYDRTCRLCDEPTFSSFRSLYKHQMQVHPGSKILSCDMCDAKFGFKGPLISHMNERHSSFSKKHQCQFCAKLFFSDREVKGHEKTHTNNRTYKCSLCGKGFNDKSSLNSHYKSKTHNPHLYKAKKARLNEISRYKIVYRCELCKPSIGFTSRKERNDHRNLVHRTFECDVCKNLFMAQESLDSHKLLHSDKPRPYVCEVCNATFLRPSHLKSHHIRKHTNEKAFHCSHCDKSYSESYALGAHVKLVHTKQQRVKCKECERDFAKELYLKKHILQKHSKDPSPYDCHICGKRNVSGAALDEHRIKHH